MDICLAHPLLRCTQVSEQMSLPQKDLLWLPGLYPAFIFLSISTHGIFNITACLPH